MLPILQVDGKPRGLIGTVKNVIQHEGVTGMWRGLAPSCMRHCIYSGLRMTVSGDTLCVRTARMTGCRLNRCTKQSVKMCLERTRTDPSLW
jgi:hypothetical protein